MPELVIIFTKHSWPPEYFVIWIFEYEKKNISESHVFCLKLHPDRIQNNDQNVDGVDRFHQHRQSFTVLNHFLGRCFIWFDLYAIKYFVIVFLYMYISLHALLLVSASSLPVFWSKDSVLFYKTAPTLTEWTGREAYGPIWGALFTDMVRNRQSQNTNKLVCHRWDKIVIQGQTWSVSGEQYPTGQGKAVIQQTDRRIIQVRYKQSANDKTREKSKTGRRSGNRQ